MWTFDNFPSARVEKTFGFSPDKAVARPRAAGERAAGARLLRELRLPGRAGDDESPLRPAVHPGPVDAAAGPERRRVLRARPRPRSGPVRGWRSTSSSGCEDVTSRVQGATRGLSGEAFLRAQKAEFARIEKACQTSEQLRCEVVTLYHGGQYQLYTYKPLEEGRAAGLRARGVDRLLRRRSGQLQLPPLRPRRGFFRVYEDGKPLQTPEYFRWSDAGAREGELTFVSGNPGTTSRLLTVAQLASQRDETIPLKLAAPRAGARLGRAVRAAQRGGAADQPGHPVRRGEFVQGLVRPA